MSPSDFGEILKPFVFLDFFDHEGEPFTAGLHPHSGIATLSYILEGSVSYIDPDNVEGTVTAGGVEWMQAGRGMWHGGGINAGRTRGFQLWIALPPKLELGPATSIYLAPEAVPEDGPARILLGSYGSASSAITSPSPINYLALRLKAGERWRYEPPTGHTVLWTAVASGTVSVPDELRRLGGFRAVEGSGRVRGADRRRIRSRLGRPAQVRPRSRLALSPHNARRVARCSSEPFGDSEAPRSRRPFVIMRSHDKET